MKNKQAVVYLFKYVLFCVAFSLLIISLIGISSALIRKYDLPDTDTIVDAPILPTVIIDAGHGGEDGGAVGKNGVYEKDLNLTIAKEVCDMLRASGIDVIMTRTEDVLLYDRNVDFKGRKKILDLAARLKILNETENCIFVSVHMNSFPQEQYKGLQVYYSNNTPEAKILADNIQSSVKALIQEDNNRSTKRSGESIFLLDRAKCPAVLVECGFLSNPYECEKLSDQNYQKEMALAVFNGIYRYIIEVSS